MDSNQSKICIEAILTRTRKVVERTEMDVNRLPHWIGSASVDIASVMNSTVFYIKPNYDDADEIKYHSEIHTDTGLFFGIEDSYPSSIQITLEDGEPTENEPGTISVVAEKSEGVSTRWNVRSANTIIYGMTTGNYHLPIITWNVYYNIKPDGSIVSTSFVPLAIYLHDKEPDIAKRGIRRIVKSVVKQLSTIHESEQGDYYESEYTEEKSFVAGIEDSVIVLGDYDDGPHENELNEVKDYLDSIGYKASLIKELPGSPARSMRHKVKMWSMGSKFSVLIDREPSGHIAEYSDLSSEEVILALLREEESGSTFMIGTEYHTNRLIELFEFGTKPIELMDEVTEWAEELSEELREIYTKEYPWRKG